MTAKRTDFELTADHYRWAKRARRKYGQSKEYWLELIARQCGRCAFSGAPLFFNSAAGTPVAGGHSQHPLYAVVDHSWPGSDQHGHEIVSNDLNDLKGHLPPELFAAQQRTKAWKQMMIRWREEAIQKPEDRSIFHALRGRRPTNRLHLSRSARR